MFRQIALVVLAVVISALVLVSCGSAEEGPKDSATPIASSDVPGTAAANCGSGRIGSDAERLRALVENNTRDYFSNWSTGGPGTVSTQVHDVDFLDATEADRFLGGWATIYQKGAPTRVDGIALAEILVFADEETAALAFDRRGPDAAGSQVALDTSRFGDETSGIHYDADDDEGLILTFRAGLVEVILHWYANAASASELDIRILEDVATDLCGEIAASEVS